jgi:flavorubredoxin
MSTVIIIYDSYTGNNETMAKRVADGVNRVDGVTARLYKIGSKFPVSELNDAAALIVGSPSIYGNMTPKLEQFLDTLQALSRDNRLQLTGKKGAVFGSYAWDGGWHTDRIERALTTLGIEMVAHPLSTQDHLDDTHTWIPDTALQDCYELGAIMGRVITEQHG